MLRNKALDDQAADSVAADLALDLLKSYKSMCDSLVKVPHNDLQMLMLAIRSEDENIVKLILTHVKPDITLFDIQNEPAAYAAAVNYNANIFATLIAYDGEAMVNSLLVVMSRPQTNATNVIDLIFKSAHPPLILWFEKHNLIEYSKLTGANGQCSLSHATHFLKNDADLHPGRSTTLEYLCAKVSLRQKLRALQDLYTYLMDCLTNQYLPADMKWVQRYQKDIAIIESSFTLKDLVIMKLVSGTQEHKDKLFSSRFISRDEIAALNQLVKQRTIYLGAMQFRLKHSTYQGILTRCILQSAIDHLEATTHAKAMTLFSATVKSSYADIITYMKAIVTTFDSDLNCTTIDHDMMQDLYPKVWHHLFVMQAIKGNATSNLNWFKHHVQITGDINDPINPIIEICDFLLTGNVAKINKKLMADVKDYIDNMTITDKISFKL